MLLNILAFQAGWFACVLGAAHDWAWAGALAGIGIVAWHGLRAPRPAREMLLVALVVAVGACWDSALAGLGWLSFAAAPFANLAPPWIVVLWALFATTLNVSLRWLRGRWLLAAVLGAAAGPAAYWAGAKLGAVRLIDPPAALLALAAGWALILPGLIALGQRHDGMSVPR